MKKNLNIFVVLLFCSSNVFSMPSAPDGSVDDEVSVERSIDGYLAESVSALSIDSSTNANASSVSSSSSNSSSSISNDSNLIKSPNSCETVVRSTDEVKNVYEALKNLKKRVAKMEKQVAKRPNACSNFKKVIVYCASFAVACALVKVLYENSVLFGVIDGVKNLNEHQAWNAPRLETLSDSIGLARSAKDKNWENALALGTGLVLFLVVKGFVQTLICCC